MDVINPILRPDKKPLLAAFLPLLIPNTKKNKITKIILIIYQKSALNKLIKLNKEIKITELNNIIHNIVVCFNFLILLTIKSPTR